MCVCVCVRARIHRERERDRVLFNYLFRLEVRKEKFLKVPERVMTSHNALEAWLFSS